MADTIRLDKYLADMGLGSRSQIKEAAKKGRIQVNGVVQKQTDRKIQLGKETVTFDGEAVAYVTMEYYMLNKPQGVLSATEDKIYPTVLDLIDEKMRKDLFPVGRLDIDTEGLQLITNDGELAHQLLSPRHHVDKLYFAMVEGELPKDAERQFKEGLVLSDGTPVMPAVLEILDPDDPAARKNRPQKLPASFDHAEKEAEAVPVLITIQEGKFHQVKRMFEALDCRVVYLKRLAMGALKLDESLKTGEYRRLTEEEIACLRK